MRDRGKWVRCGTLTRMGKKYHLITIGTGPNAPLDYALVMEHHLLAMSTLWGSLFQLERDRYTFSSAQNQ